MHGVLSTFAAIYDTGFRIASCPFSPTFNIDHILNQSPILRPRITFSDVGRIDTSHLYAVELERELQVRMSCAEDQFVVHIVVELAISAAAPDEILLPDFTQVGSHRAASLHLGSRVPGCHWRLRKQEIVSEYEFIWSEITIEGPKEREFDRLISIQVRANVDKPRHLGLMGLSASSATVYYV